ncbi:MAG: dephospho-CoA kinase [Bacteroidales bacterium]|nr:dephospho-CoA kinase [Bacteroidales bacterium]
MIKVGLTGSIGSGKSLISSIFSKLGVPVFDSDSSAKELYKSDSILKDLIQDAFGKESYLDSGDLNKKFIAKVIFNDKKKLNLINQIVHPRVKLDFEKWLTENNKAKYVIKEAAILIESGAYKHMDKIIVVSAPLELRIERVIQRDNLNEPEIRKRINNQLSEDDLLKFADFVISNNGKDAVLPQILKIHKQLIK